MVLQHGSTLEYLWEPVRNADAWETLNPGQTCQTRVAIDGPVYQCYHQLPLVVWNQYCDLAFLTFLHDVCGESGDRVGSGEGGRLAL